MKFTLADLVGNFYLIELLLNQTNAKIEAENGEERNRFTSVQGPWTLTKPTPKPGEPSMQAELSRDRLWHLSVPLVYLFLI